MQRLTDLSTDEWMIHILENHHQPERATLKELDQLLNRILLAHYGHDKELVLKLHRNFGELRLGLEEHFAKEEKELFKAMRRLDDAPETRKAIRALIQEMKEEHEEVEGIMGRLAQVTDDFTAPEFACPTMQAAYGKLQELVEDLTLHFAKEQDVFYRGFE